MTSAPTAGVEGLLEPNHKSVHNNTPLPILLHMSTTLHVSTTSEDEEEEEEEEEEETAYTPSHQRAPTNMPPPPLLRVITMGEVPPTPTAHGPAPARAQP